MALEQMGNILFQFTNTNIIFYAIVLFCFIVRVKSEMQANKWVKNYCNK